MKPNAIFFTALLSASTIAMPLLAGPFPLLPQIACMNWTIANSPACRAIRRHALDRSLYGTLVTRPTRMLKFDGAEANDGMRVEL